MDLDPAADQSRSHAAMPAMRSLGRHLVADPGESLLRRMRVAMFPELVEPGEGREPAGAAVSPRLGQFALLRKLGEGGMGVVYSAFDESLARKVAIKVLQRELAVDAGGKARLLREAQAMARLSHPNVVQVFELGEQRGQVYIAMEFVAGTTLRAWERAAGGRAWRTILDAYVQAGHGLAAAHAIGIVHRDFKPENVLVGDDGRVRVTDFGLAHSVGDPCGETAPASARASGSAALTRTGAVLGTPIYMAPEQHAGRPTDARTDQFSYCVALYIALYGRHPFTAGDGPAPSDRRPLAGDDLLALMDRVRVGALAPIPRGVVVAPHIARALLRGLAHDPAARYPSMSELLAALQRDGAPRRRRWLRAGLAVFAGGLGLAVIPGRADPCRGVADPWTSVWNPARLAAIDRSFAATGRPDAAATRERLGAVLDGYRDAGAAMAAESCAATRVRGEQSDRMFDLRAVCLADRRAGLSALAGRLAVGEADAIDRAVEAALALPALEDCADTEALLAVVAPPGVALRVRMTAVHRALDQAELSRELGRYGEGAAVAGAALADSRALAYDPLVARALHVSAGLHAELGDGRAAEHSLREAIRVAARAGDRDRLAGVWVDLVRIVGDENGRGREGLQLLTAADAALLLAGDPPLLRAELLDGEGLARAMVGEFPAAIACFEQSLEHLERLGSPVRSRAAATLGHLGNTLYRLGRWPAAESAFRRALAQTERALGPGHPHVAHWQLSISNVYFRRGELAPARAWIERALALRRATLGPEHPDTVRAMVNLADLLYGDGHLDAAADLYRRSVELMTINAGPNHPDLAVPIGNLGLIDAAHGRWDAAIVRHEHARRIASETLGPEHEVSLANALNQGEALIEVGRHAEARPLYDHVLAVWQRQLGAAHPNLVYPLIGLTRVALGQGDPGAALDLGARADTIAVAAADAVPELERAQLDISIAQALRTLGRDADAATRRASTAIAGLERVAALPGAATWRARAQQVLAAPAASGHRASASH